MKGKRAAVESFSYSSPVGGLNARDSIASMPATDAVQLDNWFPRTTDIVTRNGSEDWVTDIDGVVETLMHYNSGTDSELFAIAQGEIYDVTSAGSVGSPVVSSLTNSRWQFVNFGTAGGQFLEACNGEDSMLLYDGSSWTNPTITGVNSADIIDINIFKSRIWLIEKQSMNGWYLPINSIQGAATKFDFSSLFKRGGYLVTMATWTINETSGVQEYAAFITSQGEVAVYQGNDPASASTWGLVAIFRIGRPIGQRCHTKFGSDVVLLTVDGAFPLSKALLTDRSNNQYAVSDKIVNLIRQDIQQYGSNFGWQLVLFPSGNKFIVNVPRVQNSQQYQYVMNNITGAWCKFLGWNAACFDVFGDNLFFGTLGKVKRADVGYDDSGANIESYAIPAFNYFNAPGVNKHFKMVRQIFSGAGNIVAATRINVNFQLMQPVTTPTFSGAIGPLWDTFLWNTRQWGGGNTVQQDWQTVTAIGYCGSLTTKVTTRTFSVAWLSSDYVYERALGTAL